MLTDEQWRRIRESTDVVIDQVDDRSCDKNYRADEDGLPVQIFRLPDGSVQITLTQTKNWDLGWKRDGW